MRDIKIVDGEIVLDEFVEDVYSSIQSLEMELGSRQGEWFGDVEYGTNFSVLQGKIDDDEAILELSRVVANDEKITVSGDIELEKDRVNRKMSIFIPLELVGNDEEGIGVEIDGFE